MNLDRRLKIGILLRNRHDGPGGLEKVLEIVARAMPKKNVELFFYSLYPIKYDAFTKGFQNLRYLPYPSVIERFANRLPPVLARVLRKAYVKFQGYQLFEMMQSDQIDVFITMDLSKQFLGNYRFLKRFKAQTNIPLFSWIHLSLTGSSRATAKAVAEKIDLFDGHLAISRGIADELEQQYGAKNVSVVYNPVDAAPLVPRQNNRFIYIGRISEIKRVDSLLENLVDLQGEWYLDIFGSTGNEAGDKQFRAHISALDLDEKVTFHGWQKNAWDQVQSAGITLLNSTREGLPLIIIESMMRGIPVLATDCPTGPADLITVGQNGWLYPMNEEFRSREYLQKILDGELALPSSEEIQESIQDYETNNYLNNFLAEVVKFTK